MPGPVATRWPIYTLVLAAFLEVLINRVMIGTRTEPGLVAGWLEPNVEPPTWYDLLSYAGLFLFYFTSALAVGIVFARAITALVARRGLRDAIAHGALLLFGALSCVPLFVAVPELALPLEIAFAIGVVAIAINAYAPGRDLGAQIGMVALAIPLLVHTVAALGAHFVWVEQITFDGPIADVTRTGVFTLTVAALVSPYCFGPRPFARAAVKPLPIVVAMFVAAMGAVASHLAYAKLVQGASLAIGIELTTSSKGQSDPRLAIYLLSIATLMWTLVSCALASTKARRMVGAGIALVVLGGYAFKWPHHFLLPVLGLALVAEAMRTVRDEELATLPLDSGTPPIPDASWSTYVGTVVSGLRRVLGEVHSLTTRGEGGLVSTVFVGDKAGVRVGVRVARANGSVLALDVVIGREIDVVRAATLVLWALPTAANGANPAGPPAQPVFRAGDAALDDKFRVRGSQIAFTALFDEGLRARAVAALDGWLAYWEPKALRYRVYPGRGAPLDHPMPLSDLALGRPATAERMVAVVELLVELAGRGIAAPPTEPPQELS